jgi:hypothetical protein
MALRPGWFIAIIMSFFVVSLIFGMTEMVYIGSGVLSGAGDPTSPIRVLLSPNPASFMTYITAIWQMLWFNYAFLDGAWSIVRYILWSISAGFIISTVVMIAQLLPSVLSALGKALSLFVH